MSKKQMAEGIKEEVVYPRYISNKPKGEDLFEGKSQERLASAIAMHITDTDKEEKPVFSRLIGLEGKWGSGKSNIIKQIEVKLKGTYTFFTFDAWGNQEDLQRRSILELLTRYLMSPDVNKLTGQTTMKVLKPGGEGELMDIPCTWKKKLNSLLSRKSYSRDITVPSVNSSTKWFVLSLLFVGIVVAYLAVNKTGIWWLDIIIALSPLILFALGMLITCSSWKEMFAMYNTGDRSDTTSYVISEQEPSVREFKDWMTEISKGLPANDKLVLVFDNMDRLPSEKVHQFWSLIQTFFADDGYPNIWCVIPYDEEHLASAFSEADGEDERLKLLKCFIDKTFPVVFRVPEPIVSDYREVFAELLNQAYSNRWSDDDKEFASRCYRHLHPTPNVREMISFINKTVTLCKQWGDAINPASIIVYVLKEHELLRNPQLPKTNGNKKEMEKTTTEEYILSGGYASELLPILNSHDVQSYLRKELAALVYGIKPEDALQIVIKRYIKNCVTGKVKEANLNAYAGNPQFVAMLDEEVHEMEATNYVKAVELINKVDESKLSEDAKKGFAHIWRYFGRQYVTLTSKPTTFTDYEKVVFSHLTQSLAEKCVNKFCERIIDNSEVDGKSLYAQLEALFGCEFAKTFDISKTCPAKTIDALRFLDYVEVADKSYQKYPVSANATEVNKILKNAISDQFKYFGALALLKNNDAYTVEEVAEYAVQQLNEQKAQAKTAYALIRIQRIFYPRLQSTLQPAYINTLWNEVQGDNATPAYAEIYVLKATQTYDALPEDERHIGLFQQKALFYTTTAELLKKVIENRTVSQRRVLVAKMINDLRHDGKSSDYPEFIEKWKDLSSLLQVSKEQMIHFADAWGLKTIPDDSRQKAINTIFNDAAWIDALLAVKTPLSDALLKKAVEEMTEQPSTQFAPANTANHTGSYWDSLLKKLIATPYVNAGCLGNLNQLAVQLLDAAARGSQISNDACWLELLSKVDYANISSEVVELKNKILNGQSGYEMTPAKFVLLHTWLRQADMASRVVDAATMVLGKVVDNGDCRAIILAEKEYYAPLITQTVESSSGLHNKLKKMLAEQGDSDFAEFVAGVVKYEK